MHNEALSFLDRNRDNNFFLYYASPLPHLPLQAPEEWVNYYRKKFGKEEPYLGDAGYYPNLSPKPPATNTKHVFFNSSFPIDSSSFISFIFSLDMSMF